jgi:hypothetical protein
MLGLAAATIWATSATAQDVGNKYASFRAIQSKALSRSDMTQSAVFQALAADLSERPVST